MPIRTPADMPVNDILEHENIFLMDENRAMHQDIRPIEIGILNLMPLKEDTELALLRSLSNTPLSRPRRTVRQSGRRSYLVGEGFHHSAGLSRCHRSDGRHYPLRYQTS